LGNVHYKETTLSPFKERINIKKQDVNKVNRKNTKPTLTLKISQNYYKNQCIYITQPHSYAALLFTIPSRETASVFSFRSKPDQAQCPSLYSSDLYLSSVPALCGLAEFEVLAMP
jgi:hypothetical protein